MENNPYLLAQKQANYLYQSLNLTLIIIFIAISLIVYLFWELPQSREQVSHWYISNLIILSFRALCKFFYHRAANRPTVSANSKPLNWTYVFIFGACINGAALALLIFIVPADKDIYYTYVLLLLATMLFTSMVSLAVLKRAFFAYLIALATPLCAFYLTTPLQQMQLFHLYGYLLLFLLSSYVAVRFSKSLASAFTLDNDNYALKAQLSKETAERVQAQDELLNKALELQSLNENLESKVHEKTQELEKLAFHDTLTQLPNRHHFYNYLERTLARNKATQEPFALFFIDLDEFKNINDTLGHDFGDTLLIEVASRLRDSTRVDDFIARISGDEFTIILKGVPSEDELATVANHIIYSISQPYSFDDTQTYISCSIGIALYPQDGKNTHTLLKHSDLAMYHAKENGKNSFHFYNYEFYEQKAKKFILVTELKAAIEKNELQLVYQPQVHTQTGKVFNMEVLLRWYSKKLGPVPLNKFIPLAEESHLIVDLENFVINSALAQIKSWNAQVAQPFRVAINISGVHFGQKDFVEQIVSMLTRLDVSPEFLELELTESAVMKNTQESIDKLTFLKSLGIKISIDDFGTGYSSMSYLKQLPIDTLKIDKSFIDGIPDDLDNKAITKAIIDLAHQFNLETIAEGVEEDYQYEFLKQAGCNLIQGHYFYRPLSAEDFAKNFI